MDGLIQKMCWAQLQPMNAESKSVNEEAIRACSQECFHHL